MSKFIIVDWCGNHCFTDQEFNSFDEAWDFLMEKFPSDCELADFEVIEKEYL